MPRYLHHHDSRQPLPRLTTLMSSAYYDQDQVEEGSSFRLVASVKPLPTSASGVPFEKSCGGGARGRRGPRGGRAAEGPLLLMTKQAPDPRLANTLQGGLKDTVRLWPGPASVARGPWGPSPGRLAPAPRAHLK